jgi:hypothetical protein
VKYLKQRILEDHEESNSEPEIFPYELPKAKQLSKLPSSHKINGMTIRNSNLKLLEPCPSSDENSPLRRMKPMRMSKTVTRPAD